MLADAHYFELGLPVVSLYLIHLIFMCIFSLHIHVYVDFKTVRVFLRIQVFETTILNPRDFPLWFRKRKGHIIDFLID